MAKSTTLQTIFMPNAGIGSFQSAKGEVGQAIDWALEAGIRLIDTAAIYMNEPEIGEVLEKWLSSGKVKREELFIVTKLPACAMQPERVQTFIDMSLQNLKLDYVDLYLIHAPIGCTYNPDSPATAYIKL